MDNLAEKSQPEKIAIPEYWKFPERNKKGLVVKQIDLPQGFLAITLPGASYYKEKKIYKGEYVDYFFNQEGRPRELRRHSGFDTQIKLRKGESEMLLNIHEWGRLPEFSEFNGISILEPDANPRIIEDPSKMLATVSYRYPLNNIDNSTHYNLLSTSCFGENFVVDRKGKKIKAPGSLLNVVLSRGDGLKAFHWELSSLFPYEDDFLREEQRELNEVLFRDKNGKESVVFKLKWDVKDGILIATQTHLPTQVSRTLRAPITLDMSEIAKVVFAQPPYEKPGDESNDSEDLVVPWREIDRIIGISLSYSRPVPQKKT